MNDFVSVYTGSSILTNRLAILLEEKQIPSLMKDHQESARLAGFVALDESIEVLIPNAYLDEVQDILEKFNKETS